MTDEMTAKIKWCFTTEGETIEIINDKPTVSGKFNQPARYHRTPASTLFRTMLGLLVRCLRLQSDAVVNHWDQSQAKLSSSVSVSWTIFMWRKNRLHSFWNSSGGAEESRRCSLLYTTRLRSQDMINRVDLKISKTQLEKFNIRAW